ncbi:MAG: hypothetical protein KAS97_11090, partial [Candidatus Aminicenantes bacterium]|nr:hypothetical protein [Candidatus Aminicenantes bacterium]
MKIHSCKVSLIVFFLFSIISPGLNLFSSVYSSMKVYNVEFRFADSGGKINTDSLRSLVEIIPGKYYNQKRIRNSLQNLYNVGYFSDIEAKVVVLSKELVKVIFKLRSRPKIYKIAVNYVSGIGSGDLRKAIHSIRKNVFLDREGVLKSVEEIRAFMNSRGFFNPVIRHTIKVNGLKAMVSFDIEKGEVTKLNRIFVKGDDKGTLKKENEIFKLNNYIPHIFSENMVMIEKELKDIGYFFPQIKVKEVFLNKFKTLANVYLELNPGFKYTINIIGIKKKFSFVTDIWRKKVFEKWAERESRARIMVYLRNSGFLNAEVNSEIKTEKEEKFIIFNVKKNERFVLGKIAFEGNRLISSKILRDVITVDDLIFN